MRITAVIPAYNAQVWIDEAIKSVLKQTRVPDEILVVDDGSTDATALRATTLGVRVLSLPKHGGEGAARNFGIQHATGDVIAWLDADNDWASQHIELLSGLLERHPSASVACGAVQQVGGKGGTVDGYAPADKPANLFWTAARHGLHPLTGSMIRRDALSSIGGFNETRRACVDDDMWLRLSRHHLFIATRDVTSYWRRRERSEDWERGAQLAAIYACRRDYLDHTLSEVSAADALRFAKSMRQSWRKDIADAIVGSDLEAARAILAARRVVPALSTITAEAIGDLLRPGLLPRLDPERRSQVISKMKGLLALDAALDEGHSAKIAELEGELRWAREDLSALTKPKTHRFLAPLRRAIRPLR